MAVYRQVHIEFWQDPFVLELTPEEKYFYLYLMTNSKTSQCGVYEISQKIMEIETGYNRETIEKLIERFVNYNKVLYNESTKEMFILNWLKFNPINNINIEKCVLKELSSLKHKDFIQMFLKKCLDLGFNITLIKDVYKGLIRGLQDPTKKEEEEKEEEKEGEEETAATTDEEYEYSPQSTPYKAALYLREKILEINPNIKVPKETIKDLQKWSDTMRKIIELDNRPKEELRQVIEFIVKDDFWCTVIQSPKSLRKAYDKIYMQMLRNPKKGAKNNGYSNNNTEDEYKGISL